MNKPDLQKYALLIIPILFLIYSAPSALDYVFHFPDEQHYTDAAMQMIEKEDYFTPYKSDGTPRFLKPIATYWVMISSFKLFGITPFTSRVLFWLAGALLVIISYLMAKSLTQNNKIATLTAFITASNPLVLLSASRSIPDILLTLFLTISAWGFLEIMLREKPSGKYYWMAYMGAAIAFETKGIPAAAFAGISMLFLLFNPWNRVKLKKLLKPIPVIVSVIVALGWFIIMYFEHGSTYLDSFYADQVGYRVSSKTALVFKNGGLGILNLIAFTIPWIFIAFSKPQKLKTYITELSKNYKAIFGFILTWIILIIVMSGAVFKFYNRYLMPIIPHISIFFALVLTHSETRFKRNTIRVFLGLNLFALAINILYAIFIFQDTIHILGIIFCIAVLTKWYLGVFKNISSEMIISNGILLLFFNAFILLYPLLMPSPGKQLVEALNKTEVPKSDPVYVYGYKGIASNIRVHSKNELNVISMDTVFTLPTTPKHALVINKKEKELLDLSNYNISPGSEEWSRFKTKLFPSYMQSTVQSIKDTGTKYIIATPKTNHD